MFVDLYRQLQEGIEIQNLLDQLHESRSWKQIALGLYGVLANIDKAYDEHKEIYEKDFDNFRAMVLEHAALRNYWLNKAHIGGPNPVQHAESKAVGKTGVDCGSVHFINENLTDFAKDELQKAGLFDKDSDYDGVLGDAVLDLVKTLAGQGHSGTSAQMTAEIFNRLVNYKPLSGLTDDPKEWMFISEQDPRTPTGTGDVWQSRRNPNCFSEDGGKTYYDLDQNQKEGKMVVHQSKEYKVNESLTHKEMVALNRFKLGGFDALRSGSYSVACNTMNSLMKKGYMDKNGLTQMGKDEIAKFDENTPVS